jgi:hypothetical protein
MGNKTSHPDNVTAQAFDKAWFDTLNENQKQRFI